MIKKIFLIIVLISLLSSCWSEELEKKVVKNYSTYIVQTGEINSVEKFTGYTSGIKEVMLAAKSPWRITYLSKNIWNKVKKGELIATLDWTEAKVNYSTANNIVNSLYDFKKQTWLSFDAQINSLKAKIEQAKIWIEGVSTGLEDTKNITSSQLETSKSIIEQSKLWLETAEKKLEETKKTLETKKKNILNWWKTAITQNFILSTNIIDFIDKTLWITTKNKRFNDKFENYLWKKDSIQLRKTEQIFKETKVEFEKYKKYYNEKIDKYNQKDDFTSLSEEEIFFLLKKAEKYWKKQKKLLKELYIVLNNSIENIHFPALIIQEYQKNISQMWSDLESTLLTVQWNFILWIKWTLQNLETLKIDWNKWISLLEKQIQLAKARLETAKKTYEQYIAISDWKVSWIITKKEIANSKLKEAYAGLEALHSQKEAVLKEINIKIAEAKWWKVNAWVMINNWKVYSNIYGIITMKMAEVWQVINAWMPIYKVSNISQLKVKTSVPLSIFKNLILNQKIDLIVEWFDEKIIWKIITLNKQANKFTKKYDIEIMINNNKWKIPVWAISVITFQEKSNSKKLWNIIIPNEAIISKFGFPSVYVLKDWKAVLKNIKIIKMWEEQSEISWIKFLDKIITSWKENIFDGEVLEKK